ncbi:hypothetical protein SKAU_G00412410 [Synaphobranchus kaupii]|uniref:Uncharacterized protein n=1 Tax=Synaphobranchus kaupii TaxID=118154 RepID=A0A9Q1E839_SYNKA|nr:hypothetical protein SKAU_G00412410 [Synaphobranchus kaupii]
MFTESERNYSATNSTRMESCLIRARAQELLSSEPARSRNPARDGRRIGLLPSSRQPRREHEVRFAASPSPNGRNSAPHRRRDSGDHDSASPPRRNTDKSHDDPSMREIRRMAQLAWETVVRSHDEKDEDQRVLTLQSPAKAPLELEGSEIPITRAPDSRAQQNYSSHCDSATRGWKDRQNKPKGGGDYQQKGSNHEKQGYSQESEYTDRRRGPKQRNNHDRGDKSQSRAPLQLESELTSIKYTLAALTKDMAALVKAPAKDAPFTVHTLQPPDHRWYPGADILVRLGVQVDTINQLLWSQADIARRPLTEKCTASVTIKDDVGETRVERVGARWLVNTPKQEITMSYDRHDTATRMKLPNQTVFVRVPQGTTVHIEDIVLHHLDSQTYETEIKIVDAF